MASFSYLALTVLEICSVKVETTGDLFRKTASPPPPPPIPLPSSEISKSGDKISDFLVFKIGF